MAAALASGAAIGCRRPPAPSESRAPASEADRGTVALSVERSGPSLRLLWDADAPALRAARKGSLYIEDGPRKSRLDLDASELRSGVCRYWPETGEVFFRLDLDGDEAAKLRVSTDPDPNLKPVPGVAVSEAARDAERRAREAERRRPAKPRYHAQPPRRKLPDSLKDPRGGSAEREAPSAKRRSRWNRLVGKVPLLRRLQDE